MSTAWQVPDRHQFPEAIVNHQSSGVLELTWLDGSVSRLPHRLLRAHCRCASCEQQRRLTGAPAETNASIRLDAIHPIADKGLNLVFSDGHGRGIFPWAYLHELDALARAATPETLAIT
jgi:DUF971 family protein